MFWMVIHNGISQITESCMCSNSGSFFFFVIFGRLFYNCNFIIYMCMQRKRICSSIRSSQNCSFPQNGKKTVKWGEKTPPLFIDPESVWWIVSWWAFHQYRLTIFLQTPLARAGRHLSGSTGIPVLAETVVLLSEFSWCAVSPDCIKSPLSQLEWKGRIVILCLLFLYRYWEGKGTEKWSGNIFSSWLLL